MTQVQDDQHWRGDGHGVAQAVVRGQAGAEGQRQEGQRLEGQHPVGQEGKHGSALAGASWQTWWWDLAWQCQVR